MERDGLRGGGCVADLEKEYCTISAFTPILFLNPPSRLWAQTWRLLNIKIQETIER